MRLAGSLYAALNGAGALRAYTAGDDVNHSAISNWETQMISPSYPPGDAATGSPVAAPVLPAAHPVVGISALATAVAN